jgi:sodium transport system permease protein
VNLDLPRILVVFRKELLDGARDRRSLFSVLFSSLIGPVMLGVVFTLLAGKVREKTELRLPIVGRENAPALVDWLGQQSGVTVVDAPENPEQAVRQGKENIVLILDKEFGETFSRALPAPLKLVEDASREESHLEARRAKALIGAYSSQIGSLRLIARGISPEIASPVRLEEVEVSSAQERAAKILGSLPMLIVLAAFLGCLQIAIDSTAGERERGSLEPLLLNPVNRFTLIAGKWLGAALFGMLSVLFTTFLTMLVVSRIPLHDLGARFRVGPSEAIALCLLGLPIALLGSALYLYVAMFARSYKEAQSYLSLVMLLPMIPGVLAMVYPLGNKPWLSAVPLAGQVSLMSDVLGGNPPPAYAFVLAALSALATSIVLLKLATRLLERESIIFGRG